MERKLIVYEFSNHDTYLEACKAIKRKDYIFQAYTPEPDEESFQLLGTKSRLVPLLALLGGFLGLLVALFIIYYPNYSYPLNIGGRPLNSWPPFAVILFEMTVLFATFGIALGYFFGNHFPRYDRDIFALKEFNERRHTNFFICLDKEVDLDKADHCYHLDPSS